MHGLHAEDETSFAHAGFSGARLSRIVRRADGMTFVLKRLRYADDWIMEATADTVHREPRASAVVPTQGPISTPTLSVARTDDGAAILMRDITSVLLPQATVRPPDVRRIIASVADLHRTPPPVGVPWCDTRRRLLLLTPAGARIAAAHGAPVAADLDRGWRLFSRYATRDASDIVVRLMRDVAPLLRALDTLPQAFLHGDLKFDNIGLSADGGLLLIDWAMTLVAAPAVELGWFLAINSTRMDLTLDDALDAYAGAAALPRDIRRRHDALAAVCGLLLRGWRKALDADAGRPAELAWWCERVEAARGLLWPAT